MLLLQTPNVGSRLTPNPREWEEMLQSAALYLPLSFSVILKDNHSSLQRQTVCSSVPAIRTNLLLPKHCSGTVLIAKQGQLIRKKKKSWKFHRVQDSLHLWNYFLTRCKFKLPSRSQMQIDSQTPNNHILLIHLQRCEWLIGLHCQCRPALIPWQLRVSCQLLGCWVFFRADFGGYIYR